MAARVAKNWTYNPKYDVEEFDIKTLNAQNLINQLLVIKQSDINYEFIMEVFGSFNGKSLCHHYDTFTVPVGKFRFVDEGKPDHPVMENTTPINTTLGLWIFNVFFLRDFNFSWVIGGYMNENVTTDVYNDINQELVYALLENKIDSIRYKKFLDYCGFIMPFEAILSPNHSEKILGCTKEINKMKAKLIKEHKEELDNGNAVVAEMIEKKLLDFALEYLKDDPALDPLLSGAGGDLKNNFKNLYIMKGAVRDPDPNAKHEFSIATSSFLDGISADEYSLLANSLTGGPYSRAKKTELGGSWVKLLDSALNSVMLDEPGSDCGSKGYITIDLTKKNVSMFMYSYMIKSDGSLEELTTENKDKYIGKRVKFRFSAFCKSKKGLCNKCGGNFFYRRGSKAIGLACAQVPSSIKLRSMKSFHDSTVKTVELNTAAIFVKNHTK